LDKSSVILNVEELYTEFKTQDGIVHAVNGISFHVSQGETLGIVGESGCGKSVSVLSVMRLLPTPPARIASGKVKFLNIDLLQASRQEMQDIRGSKVAMIFQDPMTSLNPVLNVGFQLSEPLRLHLGFSKKQAWDRAAELLEMVGIPQAKNRLTDYPHQFSGGMRQRVMIAMALACNPPLLIADEPTTALDVTIQAQIVELVKQLRDQMGMSLIWITHDLGIIAGLADRVMVMYAGFVVEEADVDELYANPSHPYTSALLRSLPRMDGSPGEKLLTIQGLPPDLIKLPKGCPFAARCQFVQDICRTQNPQLREVAPNHRIACWFDLKASALL
jgi:oligopeptide transport system ATP-binding protein